MKKETFSFTKTQLGNLIKQYRERKGITTRKASKLINVPQEDIDAIEGGFALGKLISKQTGKPTTLFYTLAGLYALDTMEIFALKTHLCNMFHLEAPKKTHEEVQNKFLTEDKCINE